MNIDLIEVSRTKQEVFFSIIDKNINQEIGVLFTIDNHIAIEIMPEFRGQGAAVKALKLIASQIKKPVLEITYQNIASKKAALKAGYTLVKMESSLEIYEYLNKDTKSR